MNKNEYSTQYSVKYPIEAFALAAVLFSQGMKMAMIVGIGLIFGDVLQYVLRDCADTAAAGKYAQTISAIGAALTAGALYLMCVLTGMTPEVKQVIGFAVLALLLVKHQETAPLLLKVETDSLNANMNNANTGSAEVDYNHILMADAIVYGLYVVMAIIREYFAGAEIFGSALPEAAFLSGAFGKPMFALVFAGLFAAIANRVLKSGTEKNAALFVCIPAILLEVPFVWNNVPEWLGSIVGMAAVAVIYLTLRKKLVFSDTEKHIEGIPVELVMLGVVYMIFSLL